MSWLRRLSFSKSTWAKLHRAETKPNKYNSTSMNWFEIENDKNKMTIPVWTEIYYSLLTCRRNRLNSDPLEFLTLPVNGEPNLTKNNTAMQQPWCENMTINDILDKNDNFKKSEKYPFEKRSVFL